VKSPLDWRRTAAVAAFGSGAVAALVLTRQVIVLFLGVTVGGPALGVLSWAREVFWQLGLELACPLSNAIAWSLVGAPAAVLLIVRAHGRHGWAQSTLLAATWAATVLLAVSYRFPAAFPLIGVWWLVSRHPMTKLSRTAAWALVVVSCAFALARTDVSLRVSSRGPHLAPAVAGAITAGGAEASAAGEIVVVGGCGPTYYEPRWVWVW
jgi:hypothetical protein